MALTSAKGRFLPLLYVTVQVSLQELTTLPLSFKNREASNFVMGSPVTEQELIRQREANATTPSWGQIIATFSQSEKVEVSSVVLVAFKDSPLKYFLFCARFTCNVIYRKNTGSSLEQMSWAQMGTITGCCHCQEHCSLKGKV